MQATVVFLGYFGELARATVRETWSAYTAEGIPTPEFLAPQHDHEFERSNSSLLLCPGDTMFLLGREALRGQLKIFHKVNFFWCLCLYR